MRSGWAVVILFAAWSAIAVVVHVFGLRHGLAIVASVALLGAVAALIADQLYRYRDRIAAALRRDVDRA